MEAIGQVINQSMKMDSILEATLLKCDKCNSYINKKIVLFGRERIVPVICECKKAQLEQKRKEID